MTECSNTLKLLKLIIESRRNKNTLEELELEWFIFHRKYGHLHLRKIICHLG